MPDQFDMFDKPAPFAGGSTTSKTAADRLPLGILNALRRRVFDYIVSREPNGAICDEVEVGLDMRHETASARINELENPERKFFGGAQFIFKTSRERNTRRGRPAAVYRPITSLGLEADKDWLRPKEPAPAAPPKSEPTNAYYDRKGRLIHDQCAIDGCTNKPGLSVGNFPRKGQLGMWYCASHWPRWAAKQEIAS